MVALKAAMKAVPMWLPRRRWPILGETAMSTAVLPYCWLPRRRLPLAEKEMDPAGGPIEKATRKLESVAFVYQPRRRLDGGIVPGEK